tara:strand:- start:701 stop:811 length:111 start_codon:yes stop_codon:yes gene_type:complete
MNREERRKLKSKKKGKYVGLNKNRQTQQGRITKLWE